MSEVNMQAVPVIAPNIQLALDYSRNFATAKPNIGLTEKEHIEGLANLLERTALENSGLQQRLTAADERADVLEGLVGEVLDAVGREPLDLDAVLRLRARMRAALKPAEEKEE